MSDEINDICRVRLPWRTWRGGKGKVFSALDYSLRLVGKNPQGKGNYTNLHIRLLPIISLALWADLYPQVEGITQGQKQPCPCHPIIQGQKERSISCCVFESRKHEKARIPRNFRITDFTVNFGFHGENPFPPLFLT